MRIGLQPLFLRRCFTVWFLMHFACLMTVRPGTTGLRHWFGLDRPHIRDWGMNYDTVGMRLCFGEGEKLLWVLVLFWAKC